MKKRKLDVPLVPLKPGPDSNTNSQRLDMNLVNPAKNWLFTWNNYPDDWHVPLVPVLRHHGKFVVGEEVAPTTGTKHLQGFFRFNKKNRPFALGLPKEISWRLCTDNRRSAAKILDDNYEYCTKAGTNVHSNIDYTAPKPLIDPIEGVTLYPWQEEVLSINKGAVADRVVYWYWEPEGKTGKTSFGRHMCIQDKHCLLVDGKASDILCGFVKFLEKVRYCNTVIFNLVRDENHQFVSYGSMEKIKDGVFFSGKYESGMCLFNPPHVFVFANFEPDYSKLSADRWEVKRISNNYTYN